MHIVRATVQGPPPNLHTTRKLNHLLPAWRDLNGYNGYIESVDKVVLLKDLDIEGLNVYRAAEN